MFKQIYTGHDRYKTALIKTPGFKLISSFSQCDLNINTKKEINKIIDRALYTYIIHSNIKVH